MAVVNLLGMRWSPIFHRDFGDVVRGKRHHRNLNSWSKILYPHSTEAQRSWRRQIWQAIFDEKFQGNPGRCEGLPTIDSYIYVNKSHFHDKFSPGLEPWDASDNLEAGDIDLSGFVDIKSKSERKKWIQSRQASQREFKPQLLRLVKILSYSTTWLMPCYGLSRKRDLTKPLEGFFPKKPCDKNNYKAAFARVNAEHIGLDSDQRTLQLAEYLNPTWDRSYEYERTFYLKMDEEKSELAARFLFDLLYIDAADLRDVMQRIGHQDTGLINKYMGHRTRPWRWVNLQQTIDTKSNMVAEVEWPTRPIIKRDQSDEDFVAATLVEFGIDRWAQSRKTGALGDKYGRRILIQAAVEQWKRQQAAGLVTTNALTLARTICDYFPIFSISSIRRHIEQERYAQAGQPIS